MKNFNKFVKEFDLETDSTGNLTTSALFKLITITIDRMDQLANKLSAVRNENNTLRNENAKLHNLIASYNKIMAEIMPKTAASTAFVHTLLN